MPADNLIPITQELIQYAPNIVDAFLIQLALVDDPSVIVEVCTNTTVGAADLVLDAMRQRGGTPEPRRYRLTVQP